MPQSLASAQTPIAATIETPCRTNVRKRILLFCAVLAVAAALAQIFATPWVKHRLLYVFYAFLGILTVDFLVVSRYARQVRWYVLHANANLAIAIASLPDLVVTLTSPTSCYVGKFSLIPALLVPAIHIYHLVAFDCSTQDWVHHIIFAGIICPLGLFFDPGPIQNAVAFFICGLPGGLDYIMLALVKLHKMTKFTEKKWNARINVWLRSPGLLITALCCLLGRFNEHSPKETRERVPWIVPLICALLCAVNGQYYMQVVVGNAFIRTREKGIQAQPFNS